MTSVAISEQWLKAKDAMRLFSEIYGERIEEHIFYHMASPQTAKIGTRLIKNKNGMLKKRYSRSDTIKQAEERKRTKGLIPLREGWRRLVKDHNLPRVKEEHFHKLVVKEKRIPILHSNDIAHWIRPEDIAVIAEMLAPDQEKEKSLEHLMTTSEATQWVNAELERQGSATRVTNDTVYHWIKRGAVIPDDSVPHPATDFYTYRFSEATLRNAPPFRATAGKISE